jgi:membrane glycosyltransferase
MFAGAVQDWCKRSGFNASHFLLPLSYASIMGGTLISMFPIAMSGAQSLDVSTAPFAVAVKTSQPRDCY